MNDNNNKQKPVKYRPGIKELNKEEKIKKYLRKIDELSKELECVQKSNKDTCKNLDRAILEHEKNPTQENFEKALCKRRTLESLLNPSNSCATAKYIQYRFNKEQILISDIEMLHKTIKRLQSAESKKEPQIKEEKIIHQEAEINEKVKLCRNLFQSFLLD